MNILDRNITFTNTKLQYAAANMQLSLFTLALSGVLAVTFMKIWLWCPTNDPGRMTQCVTRRQTDLFTMFIHTIFIMHSLI